MDKACHHATSAAVARCAWRSSRWMVPSPRYSTRSAIRALAALWVITTAVVPKRWVMSAMASSTRLPDPKGKKRGEDEARSSEGDDVEAVNLREELHRTANDDGDENLGKNDEEIKDSHVHAHFR